MTASQGYVYQEIVLYKLICNIDVQSAEKAHKNAPVFIFIFWKINIFGTKKHPKETYDDNKSYFSMRIYNSGDIVSFNTA